MHQVMKAYGVCSRKLILDHFTGVEVSGQLQAPIPLPGVKYLFIRPFDCFLKRYFLHGLDICQTE
jgi:hypothetical protein